MYISTHIYMCICIHTHAHTHTNTHTHTCTYTCICTYIYTHPSIHPSIHASMHPCIHASMHPSMHACMHARIHPNMHMHMHIHIHMRIYTYYVHIQQGVHILRCMVPTAFDDRNPEIQPQMPSIAKRYSLGCEPHVQLSCPFLFWDPNPEVC